MITVLSLTLLGFFLGMRHATDPDHVIAVSTIVTRQPTIRAALVIGSLWGVGHTLTIVAVGGAIVLFSIEIPPRLGLTMEMGVALMLIVLGMWNLTGFFEQIRGLRSLRGCGSGHAHSHGGFVHSHMPGSVSGQHEPRKRPDAGCSLAGLAARRPERLPDPPPADHRSRSWSCRLGGGGAAGACSDQEPMVGDRVSRAVRDRHDRRHDADHGCHRRTYWSTPQAGPIGSSGCGSPPASSASASAVPRIPDCGRRRPFHRRSRRIDVA